MHVHYFWDGLPGQKSLQVQASVAVDTLIMPTWTHGHDQGTWCMRAIVIFTEGSVVRVSDALESHDVCLRVYFEYPGVVVWAEFQKTTSGKFEARFCCKA